MGGGSTRFSSSEVSLGKVSGCDVHECVGLVTLCRNGNAESVHQSCEKCLGSCGQFVAESGSVVVQVHSHGGDVGQCCGRTCDL